MHLSAHFLLRMKRNSGGSSPNLDLTIETLVETHLKHHAFMDLAIRSPFDQVQIRLKPDTDMIRYAYDGVEVDHFVHRRHLLLKPQPKMLLDTIGKSFGLGV